MIVAKLRAFFLLVGLASLLVSATASAQGAPRLWLSGEDPVVQARKHLDAPADYMDLFRAGAPWTAAASKLEAFKIGGEMALRSSDAQLHAVIDGLTARHIKLALEMGTIGGAGPDGCGKGVEGYSSPTGPETAVKRIKALGGELAYVAMDEPVWFGHVADKLSGGRQACRFPLPELADRVASYMETIRKYFPDVRIGEIEPISSSPSTRSLDPRYMEDVLAFVDLLQKKTGQKLAFLHADVAWRWTWQGQLEEMANGARARGIRFGVICDGDADVAGNEAWVHQALERCQAVAADRKTIPDDLIVQSWEPLPTKMMPETDPGALTFEVNAAAKLVR